MDCRFVGRVQDGKKAELAMKISQVRNGVTDLTSGIESMRIQRDTMIAEIDRSEREATVGCPSLLLFCCSG